MFPKYTLLEARNLASTGNFQESTSSTVLPFHGKGGIPKQRDRKFKDMRRKFSNIVFIEQNIFVFFTVQGFLEGESQAKLLLINQNNPFIFT